MPAGGRAAYGAQRRGLGEEHEPRDAGAPEVHGARGCAMKDQ
jgi:hypothetical protein